jgi:hypothetical protein
LHTGDLSQQHSAPSSPWSAISKEQFAPSAFVILGLAYKYVTHPFARAYVHCLDWGSSRSKREGSLNSTTVTR